MTRHDLLEELAARIIGISLAQPVRVGVDGVDAVGKTTLADELVEPIQCRGRSVIRASIDRFHNPRSVRYGRGPHSPEGYYRDSFNLEALASSLLVPLGPGGSAGYRRAIFDHRSDSAVNAPLEQAAPDAILLFDGVFLHRPELVGLFDFSIFLDARFEVTVRRGAERGGGSPDVEAEENRRYVAGQRLYLEECNPKRLADVVIDNNDLAGPFFVPRTSGR